MQPPGTTVLCHTHVSDRVNMRDKKNRLVKILLIKLNRQHEITRLHSAKRVMPQVMSSG